MDFAMWSVVSMAGLTVPMDFCKRDERVRVLHFRQRLKENFSFIMHFICRFYFYMTGTEEKAVCDHVTHKTSSRQKLHLWWSWFSVCYFRGVVLMSESQGNVGWMRPLEATWPSLLLRVSPATLALSAAVGPSAV